MREYSGYVGLDVHKDTIAVAVAVPGQEQEAMRDLTRAREDMKAMELKARQRLGAFLLRHGRVYTSGKSRWTQAHFGWLEEQRFKQGQLRTLQRRIREWRAVMARQLVYGCLGDAEPWTIAPIGATDASPGEGVTTDRAVPLRSLRSFRGTARPV